jgi:hypothetical protein
MTQDGGAEFAAIDTTQSLYRLIGVVECDSENVGASLW